MHPSHRHDNRDLIIHVHHYNLVRSVAPPKIQCCVAICAFGGAQVPFLAALPPAASAHLAGRVAGVAWSSMSLPPGTSMVQPQTFVRLIKDPLHGQLLHNSLTQEHGVLTNEPRATVQSHSSLVLLLGSSSTNMCLSVYSYYVSEPYYIDAGSDQHNNSIQFTTLGLAFD